MRWLLCSLPVCTFPFPAGLWLYLAGSSLPSLTLIGSPNFGYRSVHRDLEAQIAIVTESRALQQQLHQVGQGAWDLPGGLGAWLGAGSEGCLPIASCRRLSRVGRNQRPLVCAWGQS